MGVILTETCYINLPGFYVHIQISLEQSLRDIFFVSCRLVSMKPEQQQQQLMCEEHEDEKINIYCLSCQTPTCSMCKVFGQHRDCDVAPLGTVYMRQKVKDGYSIQFLLRATSHLTKPSCFRSPTSPFNQSLF